MLAYIALRTTAAEVKAEITVGSLTQRPQL